jgi:hypothetical protein
MRQEIESRTWTRRGMLMLAGAGVVALGRLEASGSEFWNKKDPSEWTTDEIDRLITKSPWAKEVSAQYSDTRGGSSNGGSYPGGGGGGYPGGGMGGPRIGIGGVGIGMPRGGRGGNRGGGPGRNVSTYKGTVRWESAQPILLATKTPLPEAFADHYVISVGGIPLLGRRRSAGSEDDSTSSKDDRFDELKQSTTLQPKGRELAQAGVVQQATGSGSTYLFGFSKELLALSKDDKELDFSTRLGDLAVKAKFIVKEMDYRGKLAV